MSNITFSKLPKYIADDVWTVVRDGQLVGHIKKVNWAWDFTIPHYELVGFDDYKWYRKCNSLNEFKKEIRWHMEQTLSDL